MAGAPPVQANTSGGTGGSTTNTQTFTVPVTSGNLLALYIFDSTDATATVTSVVWSSAGACGTFTGTPNTPMTGATRRMWVFLAQITTGGCVGVTITFSGSINSVVIFAEYNGMATSAVIDQETFASGTGTAINSGNITTTNANDTLVSGVFVTTSGGGTLTPGAGFSLEVNNASTSHRGLQDRNVTATGTYAATATYSSSQSWLCHVMALKQASVTPVVATPTATPGSGAFAGSVNVTLATTTPGATLCYRTDGVDPAAGTPGTCSAGSTTYSGPVSLTSNATLKVIGTEAGFTNSAILTQNYTVRAATTFYVASTGSDAANGTSPATAWAHAPGMTGATGAAAAAVLVPGDTILLNRGNSWLNTTMTMNAAGDSTAQITLGAYGAGAKPIISAAANNPALTVTVNNRGYWTIDNLDLRASGVITGINLPATIYHNNWAADMLPVPNWIIQNCTANAAFYLSGPNTIVRNNVLDGTTNSSPPLGGIVLRSDINLNGLIEANTVSNFHDRGIWVMRGASSPIVRYNTVHDIMGGTDNEGMGINIDGADIPVTNAQTLGNLVYNCAGIGITHENSQGSRASYNLVHDCVMGGIDVINYAPYQTVPTNLTISYNVIYNVNIGIPIWDAQALTIVGNTIYGGTGATSQGFGIQSLDTNVSGLTFTNNIVAGAWTHPVMVRTAKAVWTQFDYCDVVPNGTEVLFQFGTSTSQTLAQLQAAGLMINGITANPGLTNPGAGDFTLGAGSPAIGTGLDLGAILRQALLPSTAWPDQVRLFLQTPGAWNMGAFLVGLGPVPGGAGSQGQFAMGLENGVTLRDISVGGFN